MPPEGRSVESLPIPSHLTGHGQGWGVSRLTIGTARPGCPSSERWVQPIALCLPAQPMSRTYPVPRRDETLSQSASLLVCSFRYEGPGLGDVDQSLGPFVEGGR